MIDLINIIEHSNDRFLKELEQAKKGKKADKARIERRRNETYFTRLTRACLGISNNLTISDEGMALSVAFPEILFSKMLVLGWNQTRKQEEEKKHPELLKKYYDSFNDNYKYIDLNKLYGKINDSKFESLLLCHGLSPISDTILLLADIGRVQRMSHSIGLYDTKVLLADVTWIKYNRSLNQLFKPKNFTNQLRVCLDKRKRLYKALNLNYKTFGITDFNTDVKNLNKKLITEHANNFREFAKLIWGNKSLEPHTSEIQRIIGKPLNILSNKDLTLLPDYIQKLTFLKDKEVATAIEDKMSSEFKILRTISSLFSTFDEEIFLYYFAQFFAQTHFNNFLKIAPLSEEKFDQPFSKYAADFERITNKKNGDTEENTGFIYCPQYKLGGYQLLPYSSISGDVVKKGTVDQFKRSTILLEDSYDKEIDKIIGVITKTDIEHRNRLLSDLLSFTHFLVQDFDNEMKQSLLKLIQEFSFPIFEQMTSINDKPKKYKEIFSEWMKSIGNKNSVIPFHIIPYLWEEKDWTKERINSVSEYIIKLLEITNDVCD